MSATPTAETSKSTAPDWRAICAAHERIAPHIHRTPVLTSASLDQMAGARLFFKCENLQKTGSFKIRGATNTVFSLTAEEVARGVVTHSSGNHAAALAYAARKRGARAWIVMPSNAPPVKVTAVEGYGGQITFCEPTASARAEAAARIERETGAVMVHPYDDDRIIAGQATAAKELLEEIADLDALLAPVSGGGLLSGTALAAKHIRPGIRVIGCEPEKADDAYRSMTTARGACGTDLRHPAAERGRHRSGQRGGNHLGDENGLGADEDPHRAFVGRAGGAAAASRWIGCAGAR